MYEGLDLWNQRETSAMELQTEKTEKRAKQLSMATIPLCFEFFRCRVDVLQS